LRPDLLAERFELGRLYGKSLLYGADVPDNFLNCKGASVLKALTGGDPVTLEFKGSNETPQIICRFNAILCGETLEFVTKRSMVRVLGSGVGWRYGVPFDPPCRGWGWCNFGRVVFALVIFMFLHRPAHFAGLPPPFQLHLRLLLVP
jgi:hypothetical protein